jgi:hypothetical protein
MFRAELFPGAGMAAVEFLIVNATQAFNLSGGTAPGHGAKGLAAAHPLAQIEGRPRRCFVESIVFHLPSIGFPAESAGNSTETNELPAVFRQILPESLFQDRARPGGNRGEFPGKPLIALIQVFDESS